MSSDWETSTPLSLRRSAKSTLLDILEFALEEDFELSQEEETMRCHRAPATAALRHDCGQGQPPRAAARPGRDQIGSPEVRDSPSIAPRNKGHGLDREAKLPGVRPQPRHHGDQARLPSPTRVAFRMSSCERPAPSTDRQGRARDRPRPDLPAPRCKPPPTSSSQSSVRGRLAASRIVHAIHRRAMSPMTKTDAGYRSAHLPRNLHVPDQSGVSPSFEPPGTLRLSPPSPSALRATAPR